MGKKIIITCAVTGAATKPEQTPYLPITPEQIANSALESVDAGAAIVHIHVREIDSGKPSMKIELYQEVVDRIKSKNSNVIINLTTGPGGSYLPIIGDKNFSQNNQRLTSAEDRVKHIELIKPDICSIDFNTMNLNSQAVRINHPEVCREMLNRIQVVGTKPELELFDSGDFRLAKEMVDGGIIKGKPLWQFAMGVKYGWEDSPFALQYARSLIPENSTWSAFGIGKMQMPFVALTCLYGGHVRVGMEDNIYVQLGKLATTNAELVEKARRIIEDLGLEIATINDARDILDLKNSK